MQGLCILFINMKAQIVHYLGYLSYFAPIFIYLSGIYLIDHRKKQRENNLMEAFIGFFFVNEPVHKKGAKGDIIEINKKDKEKHNGF